MAVFQVQRGSHSFPENQSTVNLSIDPVPVGRSFAMGSSFSTTDLVALRSFCSLRLLDTDEDGMYDTLRIQRGSSLGEAQVEWEVVTAAVLRVQHGVTSFSGLTGTASIDPVDLDRTVLFQSARGGMVADQDFHFRGEFEDDETLRFTRHDDAVTLNVSWFVVVWHAWEVQSNTVTIPDGQPSVTDTIDTVNQEETFMVFSSIARSGIIGVNAIRGKIDTDSSVLFERMNADGPIPITYFVVSSEDMRVISNDLNVDGFEGSATILPSVATGRTMVPTNIIGNGRAPGTVIGQRGRARHTRRLEDFITLTIERGDDGGTLEAHFYVVEFADIEPPDIEERTVTSHVGTIQSEADTVIRRLTGALALTEEPLNEEPVDAEEYCPFEATRNPEDEWIAEVEIFHDATLLFNSTTPDASPTGYRDNTDQIITVDPGMELSICITVDATSGVWTEALSWGHDIENPGTLELYEHIHIASGAPWTECVTWTVPDAPGNYIVSFWVHFGSFIGPCPTDGTVDDGERQDFTLHITGTEFVPFGFRESPAIDISAVFRVVHSRVTFLTIEPEGTEVRVLVSPDGTSWETVASGDSVPFLPPGVVSEHDTVYVRQELETLDAAVTPHLYFFRVSISWKLFGEEFVTTYIAPLASEAEKQVATRRVPESFLTNIVHRVDRHVATMQRVANIVRSIVSRALSERTKKETVFSRLQTTISKARGIRAVERRIENVVESIVSRVTASATFTRSLQSTVGTMVSRALRSVVLQKTVTSHTGTIHSFTRALRRKVHALQSYVVAVRDRATMRVRFRVQSGVGTIAFTLRWIVLGTRDVVSYVGTIQSRVRILIGDFQLVTSYVKRMVTDAQRQAVAHRSTVSFLHAFVGRIRMVADTIRDAASYVAGTVSRTVRSIAITKVPVSHLKGISKPVRTIRLQTHRLASFMNRIVTMAAIVQCIVHLEETNEDFLDAVLFDTLEAVDDRLRLLSEEVDFVFQEGIVTSSTFIAPYVPDHAFDGNVKTSWRQIGGQQFLQIELDAPQSIDRYSVTARVGQPTDPP